jgi:hypothetical protein
MKSRAAAMAVSVEEVVGIETLVGNQTMVGVGGAFGGCLKDPDSIAAIMEQRGAKIVVIGSIWCPGAAKGSKGWLFVD